jgi:FixJ family two-component response regulator
MPAPRNAVGIVEDDAGMREALGRMLKAAGFEVRTFGSAEAFLENGVSCDLACLVLDIHLPGASGIDLQRRLTGQGQTWPVIFITAHDSPHSRREASQLGAVAFLAKPFEGRLLLEAVQKARENPAPPVDASKVKVKPAGD